MLFGTWLGFGISGQLSHASPTPSWSLSFWSGFGTLWQLSKMFFKPIRMYKDTFRNSSNRRVRARVQNKVSYKGIQRRSVENVIEWSKLHQQKCIAVL